MLNLRRFAAYLLALLAVAAVVLGVAACGASSAPAATPAPAAAEAAAGAGADGTPAVASTAASPGAAAALKAYTAAGGKVADLSANNVSVTQDVTNMVGTTPAYSLTGGNPPCAGFVQNAPSSVFTLAKDAAALELSFAGDTTSTLIVAAEGGPIVCDPNAPLTARPKLVVDKPVAGRYGVWVGRTDMQQPVNGKLTVTVTP